MKNGWQNLTLRERLFVGLGGVVLILLLFYFLFWQPLAQAVTTQQNALTTKQNNIRWITAAASRVSALQNAGFRVKVGNQPILKVVNQTLTSAKLNYYLKQAPLPKAHEVDLAFVGVPFDNLMTWLRTIWLEQGIVVQSLKVVRTDTLGAVDGQLVLVRAMHKVAS